MSGTKFFGSPPFAIRVRFSWPPLVPGECGDRYRSTFHSVSVHGKRNGEVGCCARPRRIRLASEEEERRFYDGGAGEEWLKALEPIGTSDDKPHLDRAPWLIVVFAQRWGYFDDGTRFKNYYVPESVGIATGFLLAALHHAGLTTLTHTPNPMKFLNEMFGRPASEKPTMIIAVGHPSKDAKVPVVAKMKKPLDEILTVSDGA